MFKLQNPPQYSKTWQASTMVIDKMNKQSFQLFSYAPYFSVNFFNESNGNVVRSNVTGDMDIDAQFSISEDQQFGMLRDRPLTWWINATLSCMKGDCAGSYAWTVI